MRHSRAEASSSSVVAWRIRSKPIPADRGRRACGDYPRAAIAERRTLPIEVVLAGVRIVRTHDAVRTLETSHSPTYYVPLADVAPGVLRAAAGGGNVCVEIAP